MTLHRPPPGPEGAHGPDVPSRHDQRGTGMIGSAAGASAFLIFLLFAVQVTLHLFATTTANAVGQDAARRVASSSVDHGDPRALQAAEDAATIRLRRQLGKIGDHATVVWEADQASVTLHLHLPATRVLPAPVAARLGTNGVDRSYVVRLESFE